MPVDYTESYRKMVETNRKRHGKNTYSERGRKSGTAGHTFLNREKARLAGYKSQHADWFDADGNLLKQYEVVLKNKERST